MPSHQRVPGFMPTSLHVAWVLIAWVFITPYNVN